MKKILSLICLIFMLSTVTVSAGSVPEDLLSYDGALVFFGEIISYNPHNENPEIEVSPVKIIKGEMITGSKDVFYNPTPVGDIEISPANVYLFTYFDVNNPTYIFDVTSYDTKTLKLINTTGDMWDRFEQYLNEGKYEEAEKARVDKANERLTDVGEQISLLDFMGIEKGENVQVFVDGEPFDVDGAEFSLLAESIILTNIENTQISDLEGIFIAAKSRPDTSVFISSDCKVDKYGMYMSRLPYGDYSIETADVLKLYRLLPDEVQDNLPQLDNKLANFQYWIIQNTSMVMVLGLMAIMIIIGTVCMVIGYRIEKKRR